MMLTTAVFFVVHPIVHARLMARRGILHKPWRWTRGIGRLWIWPAYFARLIPAYYRPGFHPTIAIRARSSTTGARSCSRTSSLREGWPRR